MKIKLSRGQWESMGRQAGWLKKSMRDVRDAIIDFDSLEFLESEKDAIPDSQNIWTVSYNNSTLSDQELLTSISSSVGQGLQFYIELFRAANFSAFNVNNGKRLTAEELARVVFPNAEAFWDALKQSDEVYATERAIEQREIEMGDDQSLGEYEKYGPDRPLPQV